MEKPASLRAHITGHLPELDRDPERLKIWVDNGTIRSTQTASFAFQYGYSVNLLLIDWASHPSILFVLILDWVRRHQPDLVASTAAPGFSFEADIIDKDLHDIQVTLTLTEAVTAVRREDGGWDMQHLTEPETMFPDDLPIEESGPLLTELWWRGERVLPNPS